MNPHFGAETVKHQIAIIPILTGAITVYGPAIDRRGYEGEAVFIVVRGDPTGTPDDFAINVTIQESDAQSNGVKAYTDVDAAADVDSGDDAIPEMDFDSATSGIEILKIKLENRKAFLRTKLVVTVSGGATPKVPISGIVTLYGARDIPVTQPDQDSTGVLSST